MMDWQRQLLHLSQKVSSFMEFLILFTILFLLELLYFKIAEKFNIIDKPNQRSSHSVVTLRGGGIVFYLSALAFYIQSGFQYPWFFLGLTLMTLISFLDDILSLSNKIRLLVHFGSVLLMTYQLDAFNLSWYFLLITFIVIVGVINAYNFMDGINGITACYSLAVSCLLLIINSKINFVDQRLITYSMIGILVFTFFNFRIKAKTFAGDVGSVSIAYILLFCLGALIFKTGNILFILFLAVYGIDSIWTIINRLNKGENIFEAHRSHLYQYLGNEAGKNKLWISFLYGFIQLMIGLLVIWVSKYNNVTQILFAIITLTLLSVFYLVYKKAIINKYIIK